MKKLSSSLLNMALVLTLIAVVAGGILALINSITAPQIEKINEENLQNGIKEVMGGGDMQVSTPDTLVANISNKDKDFIVYHVSDSKGENLGTAVQTSENGFGGELKILVGFDPKGTILGYTVLQHSETPGLGAKAGLWFQKDGKGNIIGMNPGEKADNGKTKLAVSKDNDGGVVDAITASTITSRAFLLAIQNAYDQVYTHKSDGMSGVTEQQKSQLNTEEAK